MEKNWSQKNICGEKNDKYQVWSIEHYSLLSFPPPQCTWCDASAKNSSSCFISSWGWCIMHNAQDRMHMKLILNLSIKGNIWPSVALLPNMCERYFEYYMMSIFQQSTVFFVAIIFHIIDTFLYLSLFWLTSREPSKSTTLHLRTTQARGS